VLARPDCTALPAPNQPRKGEGQMSLDAVAVFLVFIIAIGALNYFEFRRVD
jgi:hypothetical protein